MALNGVEAPRKVKNISPRIQVVVLTPCHEDEHIIPAIRAGVLSYVLKDISSTELADVARKAAQGEAVFNPWVATRLVQEVRRSRDVSIGTRGGLPFLTKSWYETRRGFNLTYKLNLMNSSGKNTF